MHTRIVSLILLISLSTQVAVAQQATEIIKKAEDLLQNSESIAEMDIRIVRPKYTKEISVKTWTKGKSYAMTLVTAPEKEKGQVFLKRDREVWNWIPSIKKSIKLPSSMMGQNFMGTDLNTDNLLNQSSLSEDFTATLNGSENINGVVCYKITLIPKPNTAVVWGKLICWIDKKTYNQMKVNFYDEDQDLTHTLLGFDIKAMDKKMLVTRYEMIPANKTGHKTTLVYKSLNFSTQLPDSFFTTDNMKNVK